MKELLNMIEEFGIKTTIEHVSSKSGLSGFLFRFIRGDTNFAVSFTDYDIVNTSEKILVDYLYELLKTNFNLEGSYGK